MASDDINENGAVSVRNASFNSIGPHSTDPHSTDPHSTDHHVQNQPNPIVLKKQTKTCQVGCCKSISNTITNTLENAFARFVYYEFFLKYVIGILLMFCKICNCINQHI